MQDLIQRRELLELHDSVTASTLMLQAIEGYKDERESGTYKGVRFPVPQVYERLRPLKSGELGFVCGNSGNGKSIILKKYLYDETHIIIKRQDPTECTLIVSWEETVETIMASMVANLSGISSSDMMTGKITDEQFNALKDNHVVKVGMWPVFIIAPSTEKRDSQGKRYVDDLTIESVNKKISFIQAELGYNIRMIVCDYLQIIPKTDDRINTPLWVKKCADWLKSLGHTTGAAVWCGTQAKQGVLERDDKMPRLYDSEWGSAPAQVADIFITVFMPKKAYDLGDWLSIHDTRQDVEITEDLLVFHCAKSKGQRDTWTMPLQVDAGHLLFRAHPEFWSSCNSAKESTTGLDSHNPWY